MLNRGSNWRQQFTCPTIHVWKHSSFFGTRAHQVCSEFHPVEVLELSFVFYSLALHQWLCQIREKGCLYVTMYNSIDRCYASVVTQVIRLTCQWVEHGNCDFKLAIRLGFEPQTSYLAANCLEKVHISYQKVNSNSMYYRQHMG
ncbi:hypothetical protein PoB_005536200 [Plakobranchus ocellatus]|uniref:Uncharacterized protein n=1 Tax=Plakobranchus ocellatus TaxID=259542 RepID=A0AAV4CBE7_9GAST|nr:hypothetical protein PoB_005536200 [Plakobranchus ocellatus]